MERLNHEAPGSTTIRELCEEYKRNNVITKEEYERHRVKRGLRNADGTGVMAGLTHVCNVHGYLIADGDKIPDKGELTYRGINIEDIVQGCQQEDRFGFEEVAWLLIFGQLPTRGQYESFSRLLYENRELPEYFPEDMIIKAPSKNIMNKLARSVLALYSYDDSPDDLSLENNMRQSISLIARMPSIMSYAYQVKRRHFDKQSMFFHPYEPGHSTAEAILNALRPDRQFTHEEAKLLDLCMVLHAEHGGGNNSTFTTRVVTSSGSDTYSVMAAALSSLKGPKHGGANIKVMEMCEDIRKNVHDVTDDEELKAYLGKIVDKEAFDRKGLIYGMGHAVYSLSDPRAVVFKGFVQQLAEAKGRKDDFNFYNAIERLAPQVIAEKRHIYKGVSTNVDFYSGFVYNMLDIPVELYTPIFAVARIVGWSAHRMEELVNVDKIIRPAYQSIMETREYKPLDQRG